MTMTKVVNGVTVELTAEEEAEISAEWSANEALAIGRARTKVLQAARDARTAIFGRLDGLQASAMTLSVTDAANAATHIATAGAIETAKEGLRNITAVDLSGATTEVQMKALILAAAKP